MRILTLLTALLLVANSAAASIPQDTLEKYFQILTTRNYDDIGTIMDSESMTDLKTLMDRALTSEISGGRYDLQRRIFGQRVAVERVQATPADYYLRKLAGEILKAANVQRFFVDNRKIIGEVSEDADTVHFVCRLYLHQEDKTTSELYVYTLVREGDTWKLKFPPTIRQMLTLLEGTLTQSQSGR